MQFCLGTVQFGISYGIQGNGQPQHEKVYDMISYAIDHGIDQFDTASAYGEAEKVLGDYIRMNPERAAKMNIISKLKPNAFVPDEKKDWVRIAVDNAKKSLAQLGIPRFCAYLFHNASFIFDQDAVKALYSIKEEGLTDRIGVSIYTPEEAMKALEYPQIEAIQVPYNLFDRRLDKCGFFKKAKEKSVTVYARSSLLQGLAVMDSNCLPNRVSFAKDYLLHFESICNEFKVSKISAAIGYVAKKQGIDYVVFGVDNLSQLQEYIMLENVDIPEDMINRIDECFADVPEKLVNPVMWK